jgi:hypothetical protein
MDKQDHALWIPEKEVPELIYLTVLVLMKQ